MTKPRSEWTAEDRQAATLKARQAARYSFARKRIERIAAANPQLTREQRESLAGILLHSGAA